MSTMTPIKSKNQGVQFDVHMNEGGIISTSHSTRAITVPNFETLFANYTESQPQEDEFSSPVGKELL